MAAVVGRRKKMTLMWTRQTRCTVVAVTGHDRVVVMVMSKPMM